MIEAHSAFFSMSPTDAFWTLRILPRIGSSAWNSELRASFAVPSAESPSTMNSSVRSLSVARQSASFEGSADGLERVLAALGVLVLAGRDPGAGGAVDLLHQRPRLALVGGLGRGEELCEPPGDDLADLGADGRGAEDLLGLPLELGLGLADRDHGGEALQDVILLDVGVVHLEHLRRPHRVVERLDQGGLEAGHVGAALGRGDHVDERAQLGLVAGAPAQRDVDAEVALDVLRGHVALVVEHRHGLGEGAGALDAQHLGDRFVVGQELDELRDAAVVAELLLDRVLPRRSRITSSRPGTMNDVWRARPSSPSNSKAASLVKIWRSGQNRIRVPVLPFATRLPLRVRPDFGVKGRPGPSPSKTPGTPRWKLSPCCAGERSTSMSIRDDSALTTDRPTPCRPPVATYEPPPNLPPAWSLVADHLDTRQPGLRLLVGRDAATVVVDLDRVVGVEGDLDPVGRAGQRLVDAVVDDLPQAVHEAAGVGRADVHAGALAHRLEPLEDEEVGRVVGLVGDGAAPLFLVGGGTSVRPRIYPRHAGHRCRHACGVGAGGGSTVVALHHPKGSGTGCGARGGVPGFATGIAPEASHSASDRIVAAGHHQVGP